ncbi:MAG: TetR/AcrR family transcriptional regulator [Candidatus Obscuribacterales bacterium]|nr:TetR/AcrR family transcriptional regulator [Candidatus Obscuribacterales bacterium]
MARKTNSKTRRSQIVSALGELMAEKGYDGATVQLIAQKAGLTPGLLHYHFKSKLEILQALVDSISETVTNRFKSRLEMNSSAQEKLKAFIDAHLALGEDAEPRSLACWICIGAEALRQAEIRGAYQKISAIEIDCLENLIGDCLKAQKRSLKNQRALALGTFAAIEGSYRLLIAAPEQIEAGFAAATVLAMTLGAINSQPTA